MIHIKLQDTAFEDNPTFQVLYDFCNNTIFGRKFSNWIQIDSVWDFLQMLGYTIHYTSSSDKRSKYSIVGWYGFDTDADKAIALSKKLKEMS